MNRRYSGKVIGSRTLFALAVLSPITACVNVDFQEPVSRFSGSMTTANAIIGTYFTEMNDFEREVYLQQALYDPTMELGTVSPSGGRTGLLPFFSAESIKARLDALSLLTAYGERLAALAGADAPSRFNAGSQVLGTNLENLAATFDDLGSSTDGQPADATASQYVGPISSIVGIFGEMYLDARRDEALARAVTEGAPQVDAVLNQIEEDLVSVIDPLRVTGILQQLADSQAYYNSNRSTMTFEQREAMLKRIDTIAARYQAAVTARPGEAVDGIRDAHAALVQYATSPRKPEDLVTLSAAIETFNNRLRPLVENLRKLEGEDS